MPMTIFTGGAWRRGSPSVRVGDAWRKVANGWIMHNGVFVPFYSGVPKIGEFYRGGWMAGVIDTRASGGQRYMVLVAPRAVWSDTTRAFSGRRNTLASAQWSSRWNGLANSNAFAAAFPSSLPALARALTSGGFNDWYLPAQDEIELIYRNLKPTAGANTAGQGANPSSDPVGAAYTASIPGQTAIAAFQSGGAEALSAASFWSSTWDRDGTDNVPTEVYASMWNEAGSTVNSPSGYTAVATNTPPGAQQVQVDIYAGGSFFGAAIYNTNTFPPLQQGPVGTIVTEGRSGLVINGVTFSVTGRWKNSTTTTVQYPTQSPKTKSFANGSGSFSNMDALLAARAVRRIVF